MLKWTSSFLCLLFLTLPIQAGGKSFSGGGGRSFSGGGGKSFSGGGGFKPSVTPRPSITPKPSFTPAPKPAVGKSYSSTPPPAKPVAAKGNSAGSVSEKPNKVSFDPAAVRDKRTDVSRQAYIASQVKSQLKQVEQVKSIPQEKQATRETRSSEAYRKYKIDSSPQVIHTTTHVYHDTYNPYFFLWLADRSLDDRAYWYYHHQASMDPDRYRDLVSKDAQLEARIRELEGQKVQKDESYTPKGIDPDLQYDDNFVKEVNHPHEVTLSGGHLFGWLCFAIVIVVLLVLIGYMVFVYRF